MKVAKYSPIILMLFYFVNNNSLINPIYISGHLKENIKGPTIRLIGLIITVKGDDKVLAKDTVKAGGTFFISFTPGNQHSFDFFCSGLGVDTILIGSFNSFKNDNPTLTFNLPATLRKNSLGQIICMKCKKADRVYKIKQNHASPSAKIATYFCDRDKVRF